MSTLLGIFFLSLASIRRSERFRAKRPVHVDTDGEESVASSSGSHICAAPFFFYFCVLAEFSPPSRASTLVGANRVDSKSFVEPHAFPHTCTHTRFRNFGVSDKYQIRSRTIFVSDGPNRKILLQKIFWSDQTKGYNGKAVSDQM